MCVGVYSVLYFFRPFGHCCIFSKPINLEVLLLSIQTYVSFRLSLVSRVYLNFSIRNKFINLLPCGLLVDNNTFSKIYVFKSLTGYTDYGGYENRNAHFLIIIKSKIMKSLCWLF